MNGKEAVGEETVIEAGAMATCNRCGAKGLTPKPLRAARENRNAYRLLDTCTLPCGHMDSHWVITN